MFCRFCGTQIPDSVKFCPNCGANLAPAAPAETPASNGYTFTPAPAAPEQNAMPSCTYTAPVPTSASAAPVRGMKWFKFIIYFQLWVGMLANLVDAGKYFTGGFYEGNAELAYAYYPALKLLDIVMGIFCLTFAVYAVVVQRSLAKFRAKGPKMYYILLGASIAVTLLYLLVGSIILGESVFSLDIGVSLIVSVVMIFVNIQYFNNRGHLFVNP